MSNRKAKPSKAARTRKRNAALRRREARKTPLGRLCADGATSAENTRRRLQWLAQVWGIPQTDIPKKPHTLSDELTEFCEKHHVNLDWLLCGDLGSLQRMTRERKLAPTQKPATSRAFRNVSAAAACSASDAPPLLPEFGPSAGGDQSWSMGP